jgi:hypothetical protein
LKLKSVLKIVCVEVKLYPINQIFAGQAGMVTSQKGSSYQSGVQDSIDPIPTFPIPLPVCLRA